MYTEGKMKKIFILVIFTIFLSGCTNGYTTQSADIAEFVTKMSEKRMNIKEYSMSGTADYKVPKLNVPSISFESKVKQEKWKLKIDNTKGINEYYSDGNKLYVKTKNGYIQDNRPIPHSLDMLNPAKIMLIWDFDLNTNSKCPLVKAQLAKRITKKGMFKCRLIKFGDSESRYLYREACIDENTGIAVYFKQVANDKEMIINAKKFHI